MPVNLQRLSICAPIVTSLLTISIIGCPCASLADAAAHENVAPQGAAKSTDAATVSPASIPTSSATAIADSRVWQAEKWVNSRTSNSLLPGDPQGDPDEKKNNKGPVRRFVKSVAKGAGQELSASMTDMAKDMVLVFSVQDIDPYEKKGPPKNKPAIVLEFNLVDGSKCYLRRFPDGSYAIEDGFADGTVLVPGATQTEYVVKYPNGMRARMVREGQTMKVYRPDNSVTTFNKTAAGGYRVNNTEQGYMGEARPDSTGLNYEMGSW